VFWLLCPYHCIPVCAVQVDLTPLLAVLTGSCLLALPQDLGPQQSQAAAAFLSTLLDAWQQQQQQQMEDVVLGSCLLMGQLAARCSLVYQQQQLLLPVCAWVTQAAGAVAENSSVAAAGASMDVDTQLPGRCVCIPLAVLAAARPGLLSAASTVHLITAAATLAVASSCNSSSGGGNNGCADGGVGVLDSTAAAVAVAGIINKSLGRQSQLQRKAADAADAVPTAAVAPDQLLHAAVQVLTTPLKQHQQKQQVQQEAVATHAGGASEDGSAAAAAVRALAWVARGLAMQRHDGWQALMSEYVLPVLSTGCSRCHQHGLQHAAAAAAQNPTGVDPSMASGTAGGQTSAGAAVGPAAAAPGALVWAAAEFFAVLVAPVTPKASAPAASSSSSSSKAACSDARSLGHQLSLHSMARPLWQQKTFVLALQALQTAAAPEGVAAAAAPAQQQQQGVWLAVASLLSAAPMVLAGAGQDHALLLLQCVVHLESIWQAVGSGSAVPPAGEEGSEVVRLLQLMHSCLLMLGDALSRAAEASEQLGPHVELLLQTLCKLVQLKPGKAIAAAQQQQQVPRQAVLLAAGVREVALMCLTGCMGLPYHTLHPHRRQVLAAVMVALDDDRRSVRKAAVGCRGAWSSS
jgi:hypothetical protein